MTKPNYWMVRAEGGRLFDKFETGNIVAINFPRVGNVVGKSEDEIRETVDNNYPDPGYNNHKRGGIVGMHRAFCIDMSIGDGVATYNLATREYLLGKITGECQHQEEEDGYRHFRAVKWEDQKVSRDSLPDEVKNSLGSALTVFSINEHWASMQAAIVADAGVAVEEEETITDTPPPERKWESEIREAIEGEINKLKPREMEYLVAALLKAMGYHSTVTSQSGDGGYDIYASPDGLLFEEPRIRAEVKHRQGKMDVSDIRRFHSAKGTARGVFVSTGGYTKEAITEARGKDITALNLLQLAELVVQYYDQFDMDGRMLLPMKKIYLPVKPSRSA